MPGQSGVLALDWWNGNRSVLVDADLRGLLVGMTLATKAPDIYRALIEATAFGTRVIVDAFGSRPNGEAREMFTGLAEAGAQIVVNDVLPLDRDGLYPDDRQLDWRQDEVGRADHRKLYVIDGKVAWTGGAGTSGHAAGC